VLVIIASTPMIMILDVSPEGEPPYLLEHLLEGLIHLNWHVVVAVQHLPARRLLDLYTHTSAMSPLHTTDWDIRLLINSTSRTSFALPCAHEYMKQLMESYRLLAMGRTPFPAMRSSAAASSPSPDN
jgi:hypothetical protein